MGLAATQARFLACTARKSNVEYQGQQINEQRTLLANKSSAIYNQMLTLKVPVPPSQNNFTKVKYTCTIDGKQYYVSEKDVNAIVSNFQDEISTGTHGKYYYDNTNPISKVTLKYKDTNGTEQTTEFFAAIRKETDDSTNYPNSYDATTGRLSSLYLGTTNLTGTGADADTAYEASKIVLNPSEEVDETAYNDAYNQYKYEQYLYEQELETINSKTAMIQEQDKTLELQLKQLDTEQNALKTEADALTKVIKDNVESSYKTFGG